MLVPWSLVEQRDLRVQVLGSLNVVTQVDRMVNKAFCVVALIKKGIDV